MLKESARKPARTAKRPAGDITILQESFESFNSATLKLQDAFSNLEVKFESLNRELEQKNRRLESILAEKEEVRNYLETILESLTTGVVVTDLAGRITMMNGCAGRFTQMQSDAAAKDIADLFCGFEELNRNRPGRTASGRVQGKRKMRLGERILEVLTSPVKTKDGTRVGTVHILLDVTRVEKLEEMAKRTEKFAAMGEMAADIAHEVRNPLGSIALSASLLLKGLSDGKSRDQASRIIHSVRNVDNKIANLLLFTRRPEPVFKDLRINDILQDILKFSAEILDKEDIRLNVSLAGENPLVRADGELLKQVFLNIILNSVQAMRGGGELTIGARLHIDPALRPGMERMIELRFADTGPGFNEEDHKRIFDPFFSTREGSGGLGLAIVHNIIDLHRGTVDVERGERGGSVFTVLLPLLEEEP
ncbi:MAG TPA: ATP-binding protein [Syntrophales bacterium]|nr:ATP-binding protein [Syntrophales bacterium]